MHSGSCVCITLLHRGLLNIIIILGVLLFRLISFALAAAGAIIDCTDAPAAGFFFFFLSIVRASGGGATYINLLSTKRAGT